MPSKVPFHHLMPKLQNFGFLYIKKTRMGRFWGPGQPPKTTPFSSKYYQCWANLWLAGC